MRSALTNKILVLGVDGMDPLLTKKYMDQGKMPNVKKFVDRGAQRKDLALQGAHPTVTPPMWTTLSTGAYPMTHGITCFWKQSPDALDTVLYNLDSRNCTAEQLWNVFAEAGKRTLVWHWPGSSWPPTSDNPNLSVVDGAQPGGVNMGVSIIDWEKIVVASEEVQQIQYKPHGASDAGAGCIIADLGDAVAETGGNERVKGLLGGAKVKQNLILSEADSEIETLGKVACDLVSSPIQAAKGWANAPEGAKEFTVITSAGFVRRPSLILQNEQGVYDKVAIYKSKKEATPIVTLALDVFTPDIMDEIKVAEETKDSIRSMRLLELAEDGSSVRLWISIALDIHNNMLWQPKSLYHEVTENVGYVKPISLMSGKDPSSVERFTLPTWENYSQWQADSLNYVIDNDKFDVIFSHLHNIDGIGHQIWHFAKHQEEWGNDEAVYQGFLEATYKQTDDYLGRFLHLLDQGWTIIITSDHGLITSEYHGEMVGEPGGCNVELMKSIGCTVLKTDEEGKEIAEIDWTKTKAVNTRANHIWVNLKGRNASGIIEPEDKYKTEDEIINALYNYRDPKTGRRTVAIALRNKDAAILGVSGPECGDILFWPEEDFAHIHAESLATAVGYADTSVSPIFIAAGDGLKQGFTTDRVIREVDVAPTIAVLGGVRMPAQCEGAPAYQILAEEY